MTQTTVEARQQLLDTLAEATDPIGVALASLGAAYEQLDEYHAGELEEELFRPVQLAYGRARRTHAEFAGRHGLTSRDFQQPASAGLPSTGAKGFIDNAAVAVGRADTILAELQDSLLPVEVGDAQVRAELADLRQLLGGHAERTREVVRTIGR
jgi:hypothetical protein